MYDVRKVKSIVLEVVINDRSFWHHIAEFPSVGEFRRASHANSLVCREERELSSLL